jgi:hypothetical protein
MENENLILEMCEEKARLKELNNSNEADTSKPD